jgi:ribosomal protein L11 methyltransferase
MAWQSLKIEADEQLADALSDALLELGALSVSLEDAHAGTAEEQAIFGEPGGPQPGLWQASVVSALFPPGVDLPRIVQQAASTAQLAAVPRFQVEEVAEQDWVRLTQSQFEPIRIAKRLWIVPSWHSAPEPDAINLVLDPGLAFGTGSHPTTRLCLQWLEQHIQGGESVFDYGCGSGILAIAALKLGAGRVVGVDIDPQAVTSSQQNAEQNQVSAEFYLPDAAPAIQADVVVANILTNPLKILAPLLASAARSGGRIVLSGILAEQAEDVRQTYSAWFDMEPAVLDDGWARLVGTKRGQQK